jgi:hypothetical protein
MSDDKIQYFGSQITESEEPVTEPLQPESQVIVIPDILELPPMEEPGPRFAKPLSPRHRELCRLLALGHTNNEICKILGYVTSRLSILKNSARIRQEVLKLQDKLFDKSIDERIKDLGRDAVDVMEEILIDPQIDILKKESAARWIIEKNVGKPTQQLDVNANVSIGVFMDKLEAMQEVGPGIKALEAGEEEVVEVVATPHDDWLDKNL